MKRLILAATLAAGAAVVVPAEPASAHNFDAYSYFSCAAVRRDPLNSDHVIVHSHPIYIDSRQVWYYCDTHDIDTRCEYVAVRTATRISGPYGTECQVIPE